MMWMFLVTNFCVFCDADLNKAITFMYPVILWLKMSAKLIALLLASLKTIFVFNEEKNISCWKHIATI